MVFPSPRLQTRLSSSSPMASPLPRKKFLTGSDVDEKQAEALEMATFLANAVGKRVEELQQDKVGYIANKMSTWMALGWGGDGRRQRYLTENGVIQQLLKVLGCNISEGVMIQVVQALHFLSIGEDANAGFRRESMLKGGGMRLFVSLLDDKRKTGNSLLENAVKAICEVGQGAAGVGALAALLRRDKLPSEETLSTLLKTVEMASRKDRTRKILWEADVVGSIATVLSRRPLPSQLSSSALMLCLQTLKQMGVGNANPTKRKDPKKMSMVDGAASDSDPNSPTSPKIERLRSKGEAGEDNKDGDGQGRRGSVSSVSSVMIPNTQEYENTRVLVASGVIEAFVSMLSLSPLPEVASVVLVVEGLSTMSENAEAQQAIIDSDGLRAVMTVVEHSSLSETVLGPTEEGLLRDFVSMLTNLFSGPFEKEARDKWTDNNGIKFIVKMLSHPFLEGDTLLLEWAIHQVSLLVQPDPRTPEDRTDTSEVDNATDAAHKYKMCADLTTPEAIKTLAASMTRQSLSREARVTLCHLLDASIHAVTEGYKKSGGGSGSYHDNPSKHSYAEAHLANDVAVALKAIVRLIKYYSEADDKTCLACLRLTSLICHASADASLSLSDRDIGYLVRVWHGVLEIPEVPISDEVPEALSILARLMPVLTKNDNFDVFIAKDGFDVTFAVLDARPLLDETLILQCLELMTTLIEENFELDGFWVQTFFRSLLLLAGEETLYSGLQSVISTTIHQLTSGSYSNEVLHTLREVQASDTCLSVLRRFVDGTQTSMSNVLVKTILDLLEQLIEDSLGEGGQSEGGDVTREAGRGDLVVYLNSVGMSALFVQLLMDGMAGRHRQAHPSYHAHHSQESHPAAVKNESDVASEDIYKMVLRLIMRTAKEDASAFEQAKGLELLTMALRTFTEHSHGSEDGPVGSTKRWLDANTCRKIGILLCDIIAKESLQLEALKGGTVQALVLLLQKLGPPGKSPDEADLVMKSFQLFYFLSLESCGSRHNLIDIGVSRALHNPRTFSMRGGGKKLQKMMELFDNIVLVLFGAQNYSAYEYGERKQREHSAASDLLISEAGVQALKQDLDAELGILKELLASLSIEPHCAGMGTRNGSVSATNPRRSSSFSQLDLTSVAANENEALAEFANDIPKRHCALKALMGLRNLACSDRSRIMVVKTTGVVASLFEYVTLASALVAGTQSDLVGAVVGHLRVALETVMHLLYLHDQAYSLYEFKKDWNHPVTWEEIRELVSNGQALSQELHEMGAVTTLRDMSLWQVMDKGENEDRLKLSAAVGSMLEVLERWDAEKQSEEWLDKTSKVENLAELEQAEYVVPRVDLSLHMTRMDAERLDEAANGGRQSDHVMVLFEEGSRDRVEELVGDMEDNGLRVWIETRDLAMASPDAVVSTWVSALSCASAVVVCVSVAFQQSTVGRKLCELAKDCGKSILFVSTLKPAVYEPRDWIMGLSITGSGELSVYDGTSERGIDRLIGDLKGDTAQRGDVGGGQDPRATNTTEDITPPTMSAITPRNITLDMSITSGKDTPNSLGSHLRLPSMSSATPSPQAPGSPSVRRGKPPSAMKAAELAKWIRDRTSNGLGNAANLVEDQGVTGATLFSMRGKDVQKHLLLTPLQLKVLESEMELGDPEGYERLRPVEQTSKLCVIL